MGRIGSSSKKKSSKNKIPKSSSEAHRKKKSRKNKSKKLRLRDASVSSYSDDESTSSLSSTSGDDYKSRKARSRTRGDVRGSRKRVRRSSSSRGSSIDSPRVKKIKRMKRHGDSETRKRRPKKKSTTKKNKQRRDSSDSSVRSDTHSCSTCQVGSGSSSEERESERRSREKKKEMRHSVKARSGAKKSRDRSRSCSSCKLSDSIGNNSIENFTVENNSRRLRSVITIAPRVEEREGTEENKDECKEEIVYDHGDYPSCRSNDSNDGGNKRDSSHRRVENLMGEVSSVSNLITAKPASTSKNGSEKYDELDHISDGAGNVSPKEKESDVKDLESILRQRALENLKRFRGARQTNEVVPVDERNKCNSEMKAVPTVTSAAVVQNKQLSQEDLTASPQSTARRSRFTWRRDSSLPTGTEENIPPETVKRTIASLPHSSFSRGFEEKDINLASVNGSESVRLQASRSLKIPRENSSLNTSSVKKSLDGNSQTLIESTSNSHKLGISDGHRSTTLETPSSILAEEGSSKKQENEAKDSSEFQQKTMSVMRGGEMVQVSYKVYIPKKVPALARRQLRR